MVKAAAGGNGQIILVRAQRKVQRDGSPGKSERDADAGMVVEEIAGDGSRSASRETVMHTSTPGRLVSTGA